MENQVNIGDQNSQQMGANRANQLMEIRPKPKVNYWIVSTVIFTVLFFGMVGFYLIKTQELEEETNISILPTVVPTGTPMLLPTGSELNWKMYKMKNLVTEYNILLIELYMKTQMVPPNTINRLHMLFI